MHFLIFLINFKATNELDTKLGWFIKRLDNENDEVVASIKEMRESRMLIEYLLGKSEDDFRNLIDSLDEHGDGHIRVNNIIELCKVMQFIQKINKKSDQKEFLKSLINLIENEKDGIFKNISAMIYTSNKLIDSIKLIIDTLQNREEASK